MTEPLTPPSPTPVAPRTSRWVKISLAVSVALNLAVAGLALGAWLSDGPRRGMPRDISFGPFSEALSENDRRALRKALSERAEEFRTSRRATQGAFKALLAALRNEPFDVAATQAALVEIETGTNERLALGRSLIEDRISAMSSAERMAFADRLEKRLFRKGGNN
jgi:uncharacterized membrane protein